MTEIPARQDAAMRRDPPHPGWAIADGCIGPEAARHGGEQTIAAARLGVTAVQLSRVIHGHCGISPAMAVRGSAEGWLWEQARRDFARERERMAA